MKLSTGLLALFLFVAGTAAALAAEAVPAPRLAGMRRLTETEYRNSIADIFGAGIEVQGRFEPDRRIGGLLSASSAILSISPAGFEAYAKMADSIAAQVVDAKHRGSLVACKPADPKAADDVCAAQVFAQYGMMLFRRPLTAEESAARIKLAHDTALKTGDFYAGLRYGMASLMAAPDFLFRTEYAVLDSDGKSWTLDAYSRASRLSYLLWDSTPDAALLQAAANGDLARPQGVAQQTERLMASPRLAAGMRAFYADFLELDTQVVKDPSFYPKYSDAVAASAREETLHTMVDLTLTRGEDLRDLLTTRKTYLNRALAAVYGVPYNFDSEWVPYEFSTDSGRSGILTQVTFLSLFSHPNRSSPTKRGVALLDIFMCQPTPQPPANVDFSIVNDINNPSLKTVRQRLLAHATNPTCAACHTRSDPIGLALENFDSIGQYRTAENGDPIDASATLQGKSFRGAIGLGQVLHDNPNFPTCFARKMFAYGTGANANLVTPPVYRSFVTAFEGSGYRVPALLKALTASPQFFSVPAPPAPVAKTALNDAKK
ncbi:MAG: DUF1592 domain-containing protein [Alphaproteobacteria bacterium]|nr:DUF1592 domain-containing protein [Alphaproteobacteria bacterium]